MSASFKIQHVSEGSGMHTICVLLLSLGFEIGIGTTVKGTGALSYLSG